MVFFWKIVDNPNFEPMRLTSDYPLLLAVSSFAINLFGLLAVRTNLERCGLKQRLIKLNISNGSAQIIHDYPTEDYVVAKHIFMTEKSILS